MKGFKTGVSILSRCSVIAIRSKSQSMRPLAPSLPKVSDNVQSEEHTQEVCRQHQLHTGLARSTLAVPYFSNRSLFRILCNFS